jgi:hypothetical protein
MMLPPKPYLLKILLLLAVFSLSKLSFAQTDVKGRVIDATTKEGIPIANIRFKGAPLSGGQTDEDGYFNFRTYDKVDSMIVSYIGYKTRTVGITRGKSQELTVEISNKAIELKDVQIIDKGRRRRHVDTPALYVFRQVVKNKAHNKDEYLKNYKLEEYQKILIGIVNPKMWFLKMRILRPFMFALENRDTTADSTVMIPALMKEDVSDVYYRKDPRAIRRYTKASQFTGIKNNSLGSILNYELGKINVYDEVYVIVEKSFVGPFANGAYGTTYDYFLTDTAKLDGRTSYKLHFVGKSKVDVAMKGFAWIDSATWAVKSISFRPNEHANVNYLKDYSISQTYVLVDNKTWMLKSEDLQSQATIIKNSRKNQMGIVVRKHMTRRDIHTDVPIEDSVFQGIEKEIVLPGAHDRTKEYWDSMRFEPLKSTENRLIRIHDTIKTVPAYKRIYWVIKFLTTAKMTFGPIDVGRVYKFASQNNIEGVRLRLGVETNENFSTKYHIMGYGAYGLKDKVFRYNLTVHFPLPAKNDLWRQFECYYQYDLNKLGSENQFLTFDNVLTLLQGGPLSKIMSIREWKIGLENEWIHSFTTSFWVKNQTFYDIPGVFDFRVKRDDGKIVHLPNFNTYEIGLDNRYSYNERYFRSGFYRYFLTTKSPVFLFNYRLGTLDMNGKRSMYNKFQLTMVHRLAWTLGHTWYSIQVGKIVGKSPYPLSFATPGGQGFFWSDKDYNMLSEFEFVTDQYVSWYLEHHFDGFFLNKIPYINRLQIREIVYMRGLWGSYSQSNYNALLPGFDFKSPSAYPYMEAGVGVENIFKILRFDSVWRLTYRNNKLVHNWYPKVSLNIIF